MGRLLIALAGTMAALSPSGSSSHPRLPIYPATPVSPVIDTYGAVKVADPYRWLEDNIRTTPRVEAWVKAENRVTQEYLAQIPERKRIAARLDALSEIESISAPSTAGGRQFYFRRGSGEEQVSLWMRVGEAGKAQKIVDPAQWSSDGSAALADAAVDRAGRHVAYAVQQAGSDWRVWHVFDVSTGRTMPDAVGWNKFSRVVWDHAGAGFYYTRFPQPSAADQYRAPNSAEQLRYHRLGDPQSADALIYQDTENPDYMFIGVLSQDGRYLIINTGYTGGGATILCHDLRAPNSGFKPLFTGDMSELTSNRLVGSAGSTLYFLSNLGAPNGRLVAVDAGARDPVPVTVIPESRFPLTDVTQAGGRFFARYLEDAKTSVRVYKLSGAADGIVRLPGPGLARGFEGRPDSRSVYFDYSSFATPFSIYRYDIGGGAVTLVHRPDGPVDANNYRIEQVFFTARDGKRIPMFIAYRNGLKRTGDTPTLLYGYGGFDLSYPPDFRPEQVTWMDMGGIFAFPALPGGGEYGEAWHQAGMLAHKPAVFDAFIDAAQYLIDNHYTRPDRLAILGHSNGGLLVGAVVDKRPDLFGVAFPAVGVLDMLRFPKFTNGRLWEREYGDPNDPKMFPVLRGYSPYHNIVPGTHYPAMLIGTADTDDRVAPAHSLKFAARMQAEAAPGRPILLEVQSKAGHGAGTSRSQAVAEATDRLGFALANLHFDLPDDFGH